MATKQSTIERFESKVERIPETGCWIWTKYLEKDGYGIFTFKNINRPAHRVSWILYNGDIPNDLSVLHRCDIRCCVNPSHLFLGTQKENCLDAMKKCRNSRGEVNGNSKLTKEEVLEMRKHPDTWESAIILSLKFNVTPENIQSILKRKTWKHV